MSQHLVAVAIIGLPLLAIVCHLLNFQQPKVTVTLQTILSFAWLLAAINLYAMVDQRWLIELGNWPPPYGISLLIDRPAVLMILVYSVLALSLSLYSMDDRDLEGKRAGYYIGFWLLLLGITGALVTHDLFNLYVYTEIMLISAFVTLCCTRQPDFQAIFHYAALNIFATLVMLLAIAIIYAQAGSLNYTTIAHVFNSDQTPVQAWAGAFLLLFALGIKGAVFPLYFWLPTAYPGTSYSTTMLLSSMVTKVMLFVVLRLTALWPILSGASAQWAVGGVAGATMLFGVMGAAYQYRIRSILSFHIVSQLGYVLLGVLLSGLWAIAALLYFLIHNIFVKTGLFMAAGCVERCYGSDHLKHLPHLVRTHPWLSAVFFVTAMSLAGVPPLSGFWGKLLILSAAFQQHFYIAATVALIVSLFTLYSMIKIWRLGFCEDQQGLASSGQAVISKPRVAALGLLVLVPLVIGFNPDLLLNPILKGGRQINQPINSVNDG